METTLKVDRREATGKGAARKIRADGHVPGVVYGRGGEPIKITVDARELFHTLHTDAGMNVLVELRLDGDKVLAMPREVQRDHIRGVFKHVDFIRIARDEKIIVEIPVQLVGESHGVKEGGVIEHHLWSVQVEAFPQDVPTSIEVDVSGVTFFDSSALRAFLNIRRRNPNMRVVNPSKAVRKVLELTNTVEYLVEGQDLFG